MKTKTLLLTCSTCEESFCCPADEFVRNTETWPKHCPSCQEDTINNLLSALANIQYAAITAMLYKRINKGVADDICETVRSATARAVLPAIKKGGEL